MKRRTTNRRTFLTDTGKLSAMLVGGLAATRSALTAQTTSADEGRAVQEKAAMVRVFGVARRAPGLTKADVRGKSFIPLLGYGANVLREATKVPDNRQPMLFIQNFINDGAFGNEGQADCPIISDRDFVAEYLMGVGDTVVGSVSGEIAPMPGSQPAAGRGGAGTGQPARRRPALPEYGENGTDIPLATKQVLAEGTRPLAIAGREKGMHFIKMSAGVSNVAEQVKAWQALHAKALAATPIFKDNLAGFELMQRLPDTAAKAPNKCGGEMPVPDLVACFWSKTKPGSQEFPSYVRALKKADQQNAIDGASSFFVLVEEWEVFMNPTFVG